MGILFSLNEDIVAMRDLEERHFMTLQDPTLGVGVKQQYMYIADAPLRLGKNNKEIYFILFILLLCIYIALTIP